MKVVVVGGGTAGCISALLFKQRFPSFDITMIRSSEIGILGPGEGLTPSINLFLKTLKISIDEFVENTGATIKHGVMFNNWNKEGSNWFHGFHDFYDDAEDQDKFLQHYKVAINLKENLNNLDYLYHTVKNKKIDLTNKNNYAFHVDARKFVIFLEKVAVDMGIKIIDDKVVNLNVDNFDNITNIITKQDKVFDCDFVIDCSGFERILIGKYYNSEWESMSSVLPATRGLTCFLPQDNNFYPYTDATALKYGWSWKIPLQHRYGCGYVYDGNYIDKKGAELELKELYGDSLEVVKEFEYSPGFFKTPWIKNCFANGLSSSFAEPIEATTISSMINFMNYFLISFFPKYLKQNSIDKNSTLVQNDFNQDYIKMQIGIISYLHMHYRTNRDDTDFWKNFNAMHPIPNPVWPDIDLPEFLKLENFNILKKEKVLPQNWYAYSWMALYAGNMLHNNFIELDKKELREYNEYVAKVKDHSLMYKNDHSNFLKQVKENKGEKYERSKGTKKHQRPARQTKI
jgi:tryptophan halogenase